MTKTLVMLPYKETSSGSRMMSNALQVQRYSLQQDPRKLVYVLNWGRGDFPSWSQRIKGWINHPSAVMNAIDKLRALTLMRDAGVPAVEFTTDRRVAEQWSREEHIVFCRLNLQGKDGSGIIVARRLNQIVDAPMYTKYKRKRTEYRVHVMGEVPFYSNIKREKRDKPENAEQLIRSGSQGWYFEHMDNLPSQAVQQAAIGAVNALGLEFGGVDIGESEDGSIRVYEVNTAPEMGPNTTAAYLQAFKQHYGDYNNNENVPVRNL